MEPPKYTAIQLPALRKTKPGTDELYVRFPDVEEALRVLLSLPREEILERCGKGDGDLSFVPSECLVHLLRACRNEPASGYFKKLYQLLMTRILRRLPAAEGKDRKTRYLKEERIQDGVVGAVRELLASDCNSYEERLDFWEVRFEMALKAVKVTVQEKVWRETKRTVPLENPETGEIASEVEEAVGTSDPFDPEEMLRKYYRDRLPAAIDGLTPELKRIAKMCLEGIPIDSTKRDAVTISKTLKLSEKTVRTRRKEALVALKKALEKGDAR